MLPQSLRLALRSTQPHVLLSLRAATITSYSQQFESTKSSHSTPIKYAKGKKRISAERNSARILPNSSTSASSTSPIPAAATVFSASELSKLQAAMVHMARLDNDPPNMQIQSLLDGQLITKPKSSPPSCMLTYFIESLNFDGLNCWLRYWKDNGSREVPLTRALTVIEAACLARDLCLPAVDSQLIEQLLASLSKPKTDIQLNNATWLIACYRGDVASISSIDALPSMGREKCALLAALTHLAKGDTEKFRAFFALSGVSLLAEEGEGKVTVATTARVHCVLLTALSNSNIIDDKKRKKLHQWYIDELLKEQGPIDSKVFDNFMKPVLIATSTKISQKWSDKETAERQKHLTSRRSHFPPEKMELLEREFASYSATRIEEEVIGDMEDLAKFQIFLVNLKKNASGKIAAGEVLVVDWLNFSGSNIAPRSTILNYAKNFVKVIVSRQVALHLQINPPQTSRLMHLFMCKPKKTSRDGSDDLFAILAAISLRSPLLGNDKIRDHVELFRRYLQKNGRDLSLVDFLKGFLREHLIRFEGELFQPLVSHSRRPQLIRGTVAVNTAKKKNTDTVAQDVVFVVARKTSSSSPYADLEYHTLSLPSGVDYGSSFKKYRF